MRDGSIARIMTPAPATVEPTATVIDAERLMRECGCHHIPVVHAGKVVGMLATNDLLKALVLRPAATEPDAELLRRASLRSRHVADIMQRNVRVLTQTATLLDAARALSTGALHAVPVIAADGHLVGIVTSTDVIQALADDLEHAGGDAHAVLAGTTTTHAQDVADPQVRARPSTRGSCRRPIGLARRCARPGSICHIEHAPEGTANRRPVVDYSKLR